LPLAQQPAAGTHGGRYLARHASDTLTSIDRIKAALAALVAGLLVAAANPAAAQDQPTQDQAPAQEQMHAPRLSFVHPDWAEAATDAPAVAGLDAGSPLAVLNEMTAALFPRISESPVPVLLPFDTAAYLRDRAAGVADKPAESYMPGFHRTPFFLPGPSGYDAVFSAHASDFPELGIGFSGRIDVFISGLATLYDLDEPARMVDWPAGDIAAEIPGVRRIYLENHVRYTFTRYGVPYVVSILCFDGGSRYHMIACREAGRVATRFLKALHLAGGTAEGAHTDAVADTIERPQDVSPDFTYRSPGGIIPGTGFRGQSGRADYTVYSKMQFPIATAPAYANSQSFLNWGMCDSTGRVGLGMIGHTAAYRCRIGGPELVNDESATPNYAYPWRDNFCEHRYFDVGQCPAGLGHQGQDIRPSSCKQRVEGAHRCEPYQHDIVAVRGGMVLRAGGEMAANLFVNEAGEHIRFRYLHMSPHMLDADAVVSGRLLREGEVFGKVGNFFRRERATSYHLHFDMQVPTRYGWVFVNPYMTLVGAYERLIGARGTEITEETIVASVPLPPERTPTAASALELPGHAGEAVAQSEGDDRIEVSASATIAPLEESRSLAAVPLPPRTPTSIARLQHRDIAFSAPRLIEALPVPAAGRGFAHESRHTRAAHRQAVAGHVRPKADLRL
jgi:hypothetical protein